MNTHLHVFDTYEAAVTAFNNDIPNHALIDHSRLQYEQGNDKVMFNYIPNIDIAYNFGGINLRSITFHCEPSSDVKEYLRSRVRFVSSKGDI